MITRTVAQVADLVGGRIEGDGAAEVKALSALTEAREGDLSFLSNPRYERFMAQAQATAVIVSDTWQGEWTCRALIRVTSPDKVVTTVAPLFCRPSVLRHPGIHPTAVVGEGVHLGADVYIGPYVVIEDRVVIGDRTRIEPQCWIGSDVCIGCDGLVYAQVTIREGCVIGDRVILHSGVRLGGDGYGYNVEPAQNGSVCVEKIAQLGIVEIGNDVEIGANATVDRARFGRTRIGNSVKIDNLVQIGHNVQIGDVSGIVAQAGVAGSTRIGTGVLVWAQAGISGHLTIGDRAQVGPQAGVSKDVPADEFVLGAPAQPKRAFITNTLAVPRQVERLKQKVAILEAAVAELRCATATGCGHSPQPE